MKTKVSGFQFESESESETKREGVKRFSKVFIVSEARMSAILVVVNSGASGSGSEVGSLVRKVAKQCLFTSTLRVESGPSLLFNVPGLARARV
jgi:hypothetical protein